MKIKKLTIQYIRGIRNELTFEPKSETMVVFGDNGTGKSAVVDAIDFLLTGNISRISGEGTGSITLSKHGKHIDLEDDSEAYVEAEISFPGLQETILIQRNMSHRNQLLYDRQYQSLIQPVLTLAEHGHHILSRRKILDLIISRPKDRADRISSLLNLTKLENFRRALLIFHNKCEKEVGEKESVFNQQKNDLVRFLNNTDCSPGAILRTVNQLREGLGAKHLKVLIPDEISRGLTQASKDEDTRIQIPVSFDQDMSVFESIKNIDIPNEFGKSIKDITKYYLEIQKEIDSEFISKQMSFYQTGIDLIEKSNICPLCGYEWDDITIQEIINQRLLKSKGLKEKFDTCKAAEKAIKSKIDQLPISIKRMILLAENDALGEVKTFFKNWLERIETFDFDKFRENLNNDHLSTIFCPEGLDVPLHQLRAFQDEFSLIETPEEMLYKRLIAIENAYKGYQKGKHALDVASEKKALANIFFDQFNCARDFVLKELYDKINNTFSEYYKFLNQNDEANFSSDFRHTESSFDIEVDFMGRGMNPPHALHSEGHQDSMGVCLFLALNQYLSSEQLGFVVLDDVIMAVDVNHRRFFCELIREKFCG